MTALPFKAWTRRFRSLRDEDQLDSDIVATLQESQDRNTTIDAVGRAAGGSPRDTSRGDVGNGQGGGSGQRRSLGIVPVQLRCVRRSHGSRFRSGLLGQPFGTFENKSKVTMGAEMAKHTL